eukprot:5640577-Pleurochrysis_carterae.AAC.2
MPGPLSVAGLGQPDTTLEQIGSHAQARVCLSPSLQHSWLAPPSRANSNAPAPRRDDQLSRSRSAPTAGAPTATSRC